MFVPNPSAPKISIVTTVLNCEKYLADAIESVLEQTYTDWDLIVWDDGSVDDSVAIARHYAARDKRVRVYAEVHRGRPYSLRQAIHRSWSEYLGFLDADDWLHPSALSETVKVLDSSPDIGMVYTDYWDTLEGGQTLAIGKRCQIPYSSDRLLVDFMTFQFRLMRREVYRLCGGVSLDFPAAQDYDLCLKISEVAEIYHLAEPLYYYRRNPKGISQSSSILQRDCSARAVRDALERRNSPARLEVSSNGVFRLLTK
jgi:glycosyltransferase involved in cell wall biosynthesis